MLGTNQTGIIAVALTPPKTLFCQQSICLHCHPSLIPSSPVLNPAHNTGQAAVLLFFDKRHRGTKRANHEALPSIALLSTEHTGSLCIGSSWFPTGLLQGSEYASKLKASCGKIILKKSLLHHSYTLLGPFS